MAKAPPSQTFVVFGPDDFLRRRGLESLLSKLGADGGNDAGITSFDGDKLELSDVLDAVRTPSLLSSTSIVVVRGADDFVTKYRGELESYVANPSPDGYLVLECKSFPKTTRLYKAIDKCQGTIACDAPSKGEALAGWVESEARACGLTLGRGVAGRLCDLIGGEFGLLKSELDKLATFVAPRKEIQVDDVEELVGLSREQNVFGITDAIAERQPQKALSLWHEVLVTDRAAPFKAVGGLAFGIRKLVQGRCLIDADISAQELRKELKLPPWANIAAFERQLSRFSRKQWEEALRRLLTIDANSKSGLGDVEYAVEKLIVDMCAA